MYLELIPIPEDSSTLENIPTKSIHKSHLALFEKAKRLALDERRIGTEILECLWEIERRKAYSELGYDGLYTYCIKELHFTDSQAYQRIQAMRAVKELPEIKPMLEKGSLSVSSISKVQVHFKKEKRAGIKHSITQKLELFQSLQNHTSKQVDQRLSELKGEKITAKLVVELTEELERNWRKVKDLSAHKTASQDPEILGMLLKEWLKKHDPLYIP